MTHYMAQSLKARMEGEREVYYETHLYEGQSTVPVVL